MLGTLYPLFLDALNLGKISVGPPYFDAVFVPLMTPALFLMAVGPLSRWKQQALPELVVLLRWAAGVAVVTGLVLPFAMGRFSPMVAFGLLLAAWIVLGSAVTLWQRIRPAGGSALAKLRMQPRGFLGMLLAHVGVAAFVVGVTLVKGYESEQDVKMDVGDTVQSGPYTLEFKGVENGTGPNYTYARGTLEVRRGSEVLRTMEPEKRTFLVQTMPMTKAAIDRGLTRDLYVSLGEPVGASAWIVRVYYKPFVDWIWGGCVLMAAGGLLALSDRRYRLSKSTSAAAVGAGATASA